ncbi:MAG TPA: hypothetical protein PKD27_10470 [Tepidiformaceae bacterium]|nr:hypothetical protein [Tepidiformaceae bacterium]
MTVKERLHQLIDEMHEDQAAVLLLDLEECDVGEDALIAEIARARDELRRGEGIPHDEAMARLRQS